MSLVLIPGAYGIITGGGGTSISTNNAESVSSGAFEANIVGFKNFVFSNRPVTFDDTRFVDDGTHHVDIKLGVDNGQVNRYTSFSRLPNIKMGNVNPSGEVYLKDNLDIRNADKITVETNARIGPEIAPSASSSVAIQVDRSGSIGALFKGTTEAKAGVNTQATLYGHVDGALKSTGTAYDGITTANEQGDSLGAPIKANLYLKALSDSPSVSGAGTFYVDTTWNGKIQDAVNAAWDGDTIKVSPGTYTENVQIDKSLAVKGAGATETIVNGHQAGSVFTIGESNKDVQVTLSGLSITGGSKWYSYGEGGGILNYGKLDLEEVEIFNNYADLGGGIYNHGLLNLISGSIHDNSAIRDGGGIRNGGTLFIDGGSIYKNTANWGGGIYDYGTLTMDDGTISGNSAGMGGGICIDRGGTATINGGSITLNNAWYGGGIYIGSIGTNSLILNGGTITGNTPQDVY
jgi:hypothetical protein